MGAQITCLIGKLTDFRIGVRPKHYLSVTVRAQIAFDVSHRNMMNSMQGTVGAQIAITIMGLSCFFHRSTTKLSLPARVEAQTAIIIMTIDTKR